jgi:hypothetical protein
MSNEEIPAGSRWRWPGSNDGAGGREGGGVWEVTRHSGGGVVHLRRCSDGFGVCVLSRYFADATRIDAPPAVKVGDVVRDPALLAVGMRVEWAYPCLVPPWQVDSQLHIDNLASFRALQNEGVRVLALPEPAKADAPLTAAVCRCGLRHSGACPELNLAHAVRCSCVRCKPVSNGDFVFHAADRMPEGVSAEDEPERCAPGCTPAAPCRTEGVCPVFAEEEATAMTEIGVWNKGIASEWPPPARRHTPPPLRGDGLCIAGWNGRVPRG